MLQFVFSPVAIGKFRRLQTYNGEDSMAAQRVGLLELSRTRRNLLAKVDDDIENLRDTTRREKKSIANFISSREKERLASQRRQTMSPREPMKLTSWRKVPTESY